MLINVSTLLLEPVGSARRHVANAERVTVEEADYARVIDGEVALIRSVRASSCMPSWTWSPPSSAGGASIRWRR